MKKTIYVCISAVLLMCLIALITYYIPDLKIKMLVSFLVVLAGICMIRMGIIQKKLYQRIDSDNRKCRKTA